MGVHCDFRDEGATSHDLALFCFWYGRYRVDTDSVRQLQHIQQKPHQQLVCIQRQPYQQPKRLLELMRYRSMVKYSLKKNRSMVKYEGRRGGRRKSVLGARGFGREAREAPGRLLHASCLIGDAHFPSVVVGRFDRPLAVVGYPARCHPRVLVVRPLWHAPRPLSLWSPRTPLPWSPPSAT